MAAKLHYQSLNILGDKMKGRRVFDKISGSHLGKMTVKLKKKNFSISGGKLSLI